MARIKAITSEPEVGMIYKGKVVKIMEFGAFVNFFGARTGWCTSRSSPRVVRRPSAKS